ncbi:hypothetical protein LINPERPRIM_LOCUS17044 [Linum perenne]
MARRPSLRERQQVIASVIAMWFELMQQYMVLLSKLAVAQSLLESNRRTDPTTIGSKRSRQQATENYLAAINEQMASFQESIARTTSNIERLTNNWCMPEDVASRRQFLVDEINRLPGISYRQGLKAIRLLMKDPADWETFCMLTTDEMKEDFILTVLE